MKRLKRKHKKQTGKPSISIKQKPRTSCDGVKTRSQENDKDE